MSQITYVVLLGGSARLPAVTALVTSSARRAALVQLLLNRDVPGWRNEEEIRHAEVADEAMAGVRAERDREEAARKARMDRRQAETDAIVAGVAESRRRLARSNPGREPLPGAVQGGRRHPGRPGPAGPRGGSGASQVSRRREDDDHARSARPTAASAAPVLCVAYPATTGLRPRLRARGARSRCSSVITGGKATE